jgi:NTP pyrophosphatase (non-canonical NTP hydrolase)
MSGTRNNLEELLAAQRQLMVALGIDQGGGTLVRTGQPSITEIGAAVGMATEAAEVLDALDITGRRWVKYDENTVNHVKEEMVDVLFFILEMAVLLNVSGDELERLYYKKHQRNMERIVLTKENE